MQPPYPPPGHPPPQAPWPGPPPYAPPPPRRGSIGTKVLLGAIVLSGLTWLVWAAREEQAAFAPLAAVCGGNGGWSGARELRPGVVHRYAGAHMGSGGWVPDRHRVAAELTAQDPSNTDAVVCLGDAAPVTLEVCTSTRYWRGQTSVVQHPRTQDRLPVRVLAARTGVVLAEGVVEGDPPPPCPAPGSGHDNAVYVTGASVDGAAVGRWLTAHVAP